MQLYVGGLADYTIDDELNKLFSRVGAVESVTVIRDLDSGTSKGFATVRMSDDIEGEEAIKQLDGTILGGRQISVSKMPETLPGEMEFREWLTEHAHEVLENVGVKKELVVLDYGCGPGTFAIPSAQIAGEEGRVYALDVRPRALERVGERANDGGLANIETILADSSGLTIGLQDESVDVILLYDVIQDIDDRWGLLQELHRVLKGDGFLSIFPMHIGTDRMLEIMNECGLFCFRDSYSPPGHETASEVLNFEKRLPE